jgi:hypothetical protein
MRLGVRCILQACAERWRPSKRLPLVWFHPPSSSYRVKSRKAVTSSRVEVLPEWVLGEVDEAGRASLLCRVVVRLDRDEVAAIRAAHDLGTRESTRTGTRRDTPATVASTRALTPAL